MAQIADRVAGFGTTIFTEMNSLAREYNAVNLGQGMPDFDGPPEAIEAFVRALRSGNHNQYAPGPGTPELRQAVSNHANRSYGLEIDPNGGVIVTPGATEALFASVMGLVDPGEEVIVIEPYFDSYVPAITMAGAKPVFVPLHPPAWEFDPDELRAAFNKNTRAIMLNTPQNPTGRVFTNDELSMIAALCKEFDVTVISDEVYEHLVFDDARHIAIASLPDMFERTVTIGSAGKTFGMTGWKTGWVYGPNEVVRGVAQAHQFIAFAVNHPSQIAVSEAFKLPSSYFENYREMYTAKRDLMMQGIEAAGMKARTPEGTYFVMADFSDVFDGDGVAFARHALETVSVAMIPPAAFFSEAHQHLARTQIRLAFCKNDDTLHEAGRRLARLRDRR
jgi:N-succinyldiaminopimelate aminotransferase